jgi:hypothetical protein
MIKKDRRTFKPKVFTYDSRAWNSLPTNLSVFHENRLNIVGNLISRELGISDTVRPFAGGLITDSHVYLYSIQKYNKKRVNSGKKRTGDFGQPVTKFIVAYNTHVILRVSQFPRHIVKVFKQNLNTYWVELKSYAELAEELCSR